MPDDAFIVLLRVVAAGTFTLAFWPSVRRLFEPVKRSIAWTRYALAATLIAILATQLNSISFRLWEYNPWWAGVITAGLSALAGIVCLYAFWIEE